jgi:hypothetical protein
VKTNSNQLCEYATEETAAILNGERLLAPEQVMRRWGISREQLKRLQAGRNHRRVRLPIVKIGAKTVRFRLRDVIQFEHSCHSWRGGGDHG